MQDEISLALPREKVSWAVERTRGSEIDGTAMRRNAPPSRSSPPPRQARGIKTEDDE